MKTHDARSLPSIAQEDLRKKAINAVLDGKKQVEVAEVFGITRQAVGKWVKTYREGGEKALKAKRRGRPKGGSLLPWPGGADCQDRYSSPSGTIEAAILSLDTRGCGVIDRKEIWYSTFGLDSGAISFSLGIYTSKATSPGLREKPGASTPLARGRIPQNPQASQT